MTNVPNHLDADLLAAYPELDAPMPRLHRGPARRWRHRAPRLSTIHLGGLLAVLVLAVGAVTLVSAHNGDPTKVHSCVNTSTGAVRITNPSTSPSGTGQDRACAAGETATDWTIAGPSGPGGLTGLEIIRASKSCANSSYCQVRADCPTGKQATGGGVNNTVFETLAFVTQSLPVSFGASTVPMAWLGMLQTANGQAVANINVEVYVVCANVS